MINFFKTFFYPTVSTYTYNQSKASVIAAIGEILAKKPTLFSNNDITGYFLNDGNFSIRIVSPAYTRGVQYGSILVGDIVELRKGVTQVKTTAKPGMVFYFSFF